jgi:hypothetical protein
MNKKIRKLKKAMLILPIFFTFLVIQADTTNNGISPIYSPIANTYDFSDDFSTDPNNNGKWLIFRRTNDLINEAYWDATNQYMYLTRLSSYEAAAIFANYELAARKWEVKFRYKAGGGSGADGFVFTFYKDKALYGLPGAGGSLGFQLSNWEGIPSGDIPGYGIEFDSFPNSTMYGIVDPQYNHIAVIKNNVSTHLFNVSDTRIEDNIWHDVNINFDNGLIIVKIDNFIVIQYEILNPDYSHSGIGFSSAVGYYNNNHIIDDFVLTTFECSVPFFSQRDPAWINHSLLGSCSGWCIDPELGFATIGRCGCALTSTAMVFNTYKVNTDPPQLSDCIDTNACPFHWGYAASACSQGYVNWIRKVEFSYSLLDDELNVNHRPAILGMCKKGTCGTDSEQTHWVVVVSGRGNDPEDYKINDPWYKCGVNIPLATRSADWEFTWLSRYQGAIPCDSLIVEIPPCVDSGAHPQPIQFSNVNSTTQSDLDDSDSSVISGAISIYTRDEITMTMEITASSSLGSITDMVMWSDTISNTNWQSFTPFVWMPVSDFVYVRFRDNLGNVSDVYSDTINPFGPPEAPDFKLFLPITRR